MHGIKKHIKRNDYKYRVNRKLNDNNNHQYISRYAVVVDGRVEGWFPSEKKAIKYACSYEESCWNQDEPYYPNVDVITERLESWSLIDEATGVEWKLNNKGNYVPEFED